MEKVKISNYKFAPFQVMNEQWGLLVTGVKPSNLMTVSWGGFGTLWNRSVITVYVRPTRYSYELLEKHQEFSLNFLPPTYSDAMNFCGTQSGREIDKWSATDLHPEASEKIETPRVLEAQLSFECKVLGYQDMSPKNFLNKEINDLYPKKDYHRVYWGEVLNLLAREKSSPQ